LTRLFLFYAPPKLFLFPISHIPVKSLFQPHTPPLQSAARNIPPCPGPATNSLHKMDQAVNKIEATTRPARRP
jgi:hypothetical protein